MPQADQIPPVISWPEIPEVIVAGEVQLRRWRPTDAEMLLTAGADPSIQRWTSLPQLPDREAALAWIERREAETTAGTGAYFVIEAHGEPAGAAFLLHVDLWQSVAELGYWLSPGFRGQGLVQAVVPGLMGWATELGFARLQLTTNLDNISSQNVARRLGFQAEGIIRSYGFTREGDREDVVLFGWVAPGAEASR